MATITNAGLTHRAKRIANIDNVNAFTYLAIGSGTGAEANDSTALGAEISTNGGTRAAATCTYVGDYKTKWAKTFTITGNLSVNEVGIFSDDGDPAGTMLMRHKLASQVDLVNGDTFTVVVIETESRS